MVRRLENIVTAIIIVLAVVAVGLPQYRRYMVGPPDPPPPDAPPAAEWVEAAKPVPPWTPPVVSLLPPPLRPQGKSGGSVIAMSGLGPPIYFPRNMGGSVMMISELGLPPYSRHIAGGSMIGMTTRAGRRPTRRGDRATSTQADFGELSRAARLNGGESRSNGCLKSRPD
jgi:hypothetical protein